MLKTRQTRGRKVELTLFSDRVFRRASPASPSPWDSGDPVREELFSVERLEQHARSLAVAQIVTPRPARGHPLAGRLADNGGVLLEAYRSIAKAIDDRRAITPAAEWLVDNYYLVERQIREIRSALPPGYYRQLPKLADGPFTLYPRVFGLVWAFVAHTDSHFDPEMLRRFVLAYQEVQPLTIGELWGVAITLRIVLVENLRRIAERITLSSAARRAADELADRILAAAGGAAASIQAILAARENEPVADAFAVQLVHRLRDQAPSVGPALAWLDQHLAARGLTADQAVNDEHQRQGSGTVTVRNIITSMRLIADVDWPELFESMSLVDGVLAGGCGFRDMDFPTRDLYRRAIEELARGSPHSELDVARQSVLAATQIGEACQGVERDRQSDPGYHLLDAGRPMFEAAIGFRVPFASRPGRWGRALGIGGYVAAGAGWAVMLLAIPILVLRGYGLDPAWLALLGVLGVIPASDAAVALINRFITGGLGATVLPALALRGGVPMHLRTVIAVPTLLTTVAAIDAQIERLEVHYLSSPSGDLHFAFLSDWLDADSEHVDGDDVLLDAAAAGIARLNRIHGPMLHVPALHGPMLYGQAPEGDRFLLLHRKRVWNASEGRWIGWERKRGKLHELNRLLRGAEDTSFLNVGGANGNVPRGVRYVITLDGDTRLPRDTAHRLIGKMAHPLNRPRLDEAGGRVVAGYGVLQPRVTPSLPVGRESSVFQRVFSGMNGIDPYGAAVSDVYQDLFGEGSYAGKGIYDIDAFEAALAGRVPDSTMLSHDLFEGVFARAGLASDIEVVEDYPARYDVDAARHHRWARGDWQLLPWMLGFGAGDRGREPEGEDTADHRAGSGEVDENPGSGGADENQPNNTNRPEFRPVPLPCSRHPGAPAFAGAGFVPGDRKRPNGIPFTAPGGRDEPGHDVEGAGVKTFVRWNSAEKRGVPAMGRWKMFDNLRRTASAPASVAALLAGFALPPGPDGVWTGFLLLTILVPPLIPVIGVILPRHAGITLRSHLGALTDDLRIAMAQTVFNASFLSYRAWLMADAIGRTLVRLFITRRHLLEWVPAAQVTVGPRLDIGGFYRVMAGGVVLGVAAAAISLVSGQATWPLAMPLACLWIGAPALARWISRSPDAAEDLPVPADDAHALRLIARRTWRYFETFVTEADNMLPPDNFQEAPMPVVAHRTSPTNIGLYLLSAVTARDFGWAGTIEATRRMEAAFATMHRMERFRGHFYNWYDTNDLRPLDPPYISTVDSGNLAGHLIALANACHEWTILPVPAARRLAGIGDAIGLAREAAAELLEGRRTQTVTRDQLNGALDALASAASRAGVTDDGMTSHLADMLRQVDTAADIAAAFASERGEHEEGGPAREDLQFWIAAARRAIQAHRLDLERTSEAVTSLTSRLTALGDAARAMALEMGYGFLLDPDRKLLSIGYRVREGTLDPSCYDLLASEARLASFIAIAKGDVPARHWFQLGRAVTPIANGAALMSWSGSMFEYLMPSLVMRAPGGSLIEQTNRLIVRRQIAYATGLGLPWGISESAYNTRDLEYTYQYMNFGVPGLGLKRGLGENTVMAPYATALATMVDPQAAVRNFGRLASIGARGRFGFYEALDYTPVRLPEGESVAIVRAYMAHHQGMTIVAIADALLDGAMRTRFHAEPMVQATELLLQERSPRDVAVVRPWITDARSGANVRSIGLEGGRRLTTAHTPAPVTHLMSNGRYAVMLTAAGSGYSVWKGLAVTRWREDATRDDWGTYIFLRDVQNGEVWSAGFQPTGAEPDAYEVNFNEDRAEFTRRDRSLTTTMEVLISAEDDAEVRRVSIINHGNQIREIDVTSYAELVLMARADDIAHPAFMKLFVSTEYVPGLDAILATRRRRAAAEPEIWAAHLAIVDAGAAGGGTIGKTEVETDRARFLGRGHGIRRPISIMDGRPLSNTVGFVLDPIFALRRRIKVPPGGIVRIAFWTVVADSRLAVLDLIDKHRDVSAFDRAATLAWTRAQVQMHHLGVGPGDASLFQRLAGHLLYAGPASRPVSETILRGMGGQNGLWPVSISGDLPILLLRIADLENMDIAHQLLQAHEYWRMKQLAVDLVILNERASSYVQDLQIALETLVRTSQAPQTTAADSRGGAVFVLRADLIAPETRALLASVARVVLSGQRGSLADQLNYLPAIKTAIRNDRRRPPANSELAVVPPRPSLTFFNGLGGFTEDGKEYVTILAPGQSTPAPWINVIANPDFGFQVAAEGSGFSWSVNSRENQLTPWSNDPVSDRPGEAFYVRDNGTGEVWSPTASPIRDVTATYEARHGWGYSRFDHTGHGIESSLLQFVPLKDSIKISRLTLKNLTGRTRHLSVTAYVEWVLGTSRTATAAYVTTAIDPATGALFARNAWNAAFGSRVAFADMGGRQMEWTGDRLGFIGRDGTLDRPAAIFGQEPLANTVGAGFDPCGALRTVVVLPPNGTTEIVFFLGQAASETDARTLITQYRSEDPEALLAGVRGFWDGVLGAVHVRTPDLAMDIMLNGWLLYQTLVCRVWARSAFYQASGAYGFRDQLQDGMSLTAASPMLTRAHLIRAAARQFVEGDVQHWWLPHSGQGVRTRISDDRAWLAYTVANYTGATGDLAVLDEVVPFLEGQFLREGEHDAFFLPTVSDRTGTLFEHCARALDASLAIGVHGLPLMGTGDWNDGMNRVGEQGKGESVWLAWLLFAALSDFAPLADSRQETGRAAAWRAHAAALKTSIEREAWDGDWYRRAWFDDGTPLGSAANMECRIDAISQSWSVISGAAPHGRASLAMAAVERELIRPDEQLALLFTPAFDKTPLDPGYIKGYPPGVRENGGQYTHAALWSVIAFAGLGEGDKAAALFAMINPINHARTRAEVHRYKVEPYVVAADVYATPPHTGRGGWTWYTGSGGWMQRAGVESILGVRVLDGVLQLSPSIPKAWPRFAVTLRYRSARYEIEVENPDGVSAGIRSAEVDGVAIPERPLQIALLDDGATHHVRVTLA